MAKDKDLEKKTISRTQLKLEAEKLQSLGLKLCDLSISKLKALDLPPNLFEAILAMQKISSNGAKKRQSQYIGKLMRNFDTTELNTFMTFWDQQELKEKQDFHNIELWRKKLVEEPESVDDFLTKFPTEEKLILLNTIKEAVEEKTKDKVPKYSRELFKLIKKIIEK
ncbi:MAG: ribosome biogenesis factor YjgA [Candidatus Methylopumilus sp.]